MIATNPYAVAVLYVSFLCSCSNNGKNAEIADAPSLETRAVSHDKHKEENKYKKNPAKKEQSTKKASPAGSTENFDTVAAGSLPEGFTPVTGKWSIVEDNDAKSGKMTIAQEAKNPDDVFNVILWKKNRYDDLEISVKLKAIEGRIDQGGGLVWRAIDGRNYYIARYNPLEDNFRLYYVKDGRRRMLETARVRIDHKSWHEVAAKMKGKHIEVYLDGKKYLEADDSTFQQPGFVGLWTKADARTRFDDLQVKPMK